ncbi:MAG: DnaD domain protein [Chloroflexota bacterium]|nr:DnaD domain protein [Chloroflexota bacterium]
MGTDGFNRSVQYTPVPNPVLGPLLEQIDNLAELKCTLRMIWQLHQKKGVPKFVTLGELVADESLAKSIKDVPGVHGMEEAIALCVQRGIFLEVTSNNQTETAYLLNTEQNRKSIKSMADADLESPFQLPPSSSSVRADSPNIFSIYEANIGMLTPMIADELREAENLYPASWIEDAFREAVEQNKRSWRYIERILERWTQEGKGNGQPGRYFKKSGRY